MRTRRQRNADVKLILAATAAVLLCACLGIATVATFVGREVYQNVKNRDRDGDLEFRVHRVACGRTELGDNATKRRATGRFCLVDLTVRNVGDRPATFSDGDQRARGSDGNTYAADSAAGVLANVNQQIFLNTIDPGNEVTALVVFDIPPDVTISRLQLRATVKTD